MSPPTNAAPPVEDGGLNAANEMGRNQYTTDPPFRGTVVCIVVHRLGEETSARHIQSGSCPMMGMGCRDNVLGHWFSAPKRGAPTATS